MHRLTELSGTKLSAILLGFYVTNLSFSVRIFAKVNSFLLNCSHHLPVLGRIAALSRRGLLLQMSHIAWSVCLCVRHVGELCKMTEPIDILFGADSCGHEVTCTLLFLFCLYFLFVCLSVHLCTLLIRKLQRLNYGCFVRSACVNAFLYADDIILLAPSIDALTKMLRIVENEFASLDMALNASKSVCIRLTRAAAKLALTVAQVSVIGSVLVGI